MSVDLFVLSLINNKMVKRKDLVTTYIDLIKQSYADENIRRLFPVINRAIIARWSESGLNYIKTLAWKEIENDNP